MTQDQATSNNEDQKPSYQKLIASSYYGVLGVHPAASVREIRQAYRDLSKLYHPDTTELPRETATVKFHQLNEAYATLSSPERRSVYDQKIGYSRIPVVQPLPTPNRSTNRARSSTSSAYLDPTDRPLSPGEIFALFILGLTFLACLVLAITIGVTRGEAVFRPLNVQVNPTPQVITAEPADPSAIPQIEASKPEAVQGAIPEAESQQSQPAPSEAESQKLLHAARQESTPSVPASDADLLKSASTLVEPSEAAEQKLPTESATGETATEARSPSPESETPRPEPNQLQPPELNQPS